MKNTVIIKYLILLIIILNNVSCHSNQAGMDTMKIEQIEKIAKIQLPSKLDQINTYTEKGIDLLLMIHFKLNAKEVNQFISESNLNPLKKNYRPFINDFGVGLDWWNIGDVKNAFGTVQYFDDGTCRMTMLETSDIETNSVYIIIQK